MTYVPKMLGTVVPGARFVHFQPALAGDKFLYQCGDVDVWDTRFYESDLDRSTMRREFVLRFADHSDKTDSYVVCNGILELQRIALKDPERYGPLLARAALTGKYP